MRRNIRSLTRAPFFAGVKKEDFDEMLDSLDSQLKYYRGQQMIIKEGSRIRRAGLLLEGQVEISRTDFWGRREVMEVILPGEIFAESYAMARGSVSQANILSTRASTVLWFSMTEILSFDGSRSFHNVLIRNLMNALAEKNLMLNNKLMHMEKKSTKDKILSYLSSQAILHHCDEFDIPFDRKGLADYLSVERSAMSAQLSKLAREGYFTTQKNHFHLYSKAEIQDKQQA